MEVILILIYCISLIGARELVKGDLKRLRRDASFSDVLFVICPFANSILASVFVASYLHGVGKRGNFNILFGLDRKGE